jgi:hypothetical protein
MSEANNEFQLAPPHIHRRDAAKRAIRTFKNDFIAGLSSTNTNFPLNLWEKLLPQGLVMVNFAFCTGSHATHQLQSTHTCHRHIPAVLSTYLHSPTVMSIIDGIT